jgi:hypothetical protein
MTTLECTDFFMDNLKAGQTLARPIEEGEPAQAVGEAVLFRTTSGQTQKAKVVRIGTGDLAGLIMYKKA